MTLREYIKSLVLKQIEEDASMSGGIGMGYATPKAFRGKKKGDNDATKEAGKLGFKKVAESDLIKLLHMEQKVDIQKQVDILE